MRRLYIRCSVTRCWRLAKETSDFKEKVLWNPGFDAFAAIKRAWYLQDRNKWSCSPFVITIERVQFIELVSRIELTRTQIFVLLIISSSRQRGISCKPLRHINHSSFTVQKCLHLHYAKLRQLFLQFRILNALLRCMSFNHYTWRSLQAYGNCFFLITAARSHRRLALLLTVPYKLQVSLYIDPIKHLALEIYEKLV